MCIRDRQLQGKLRKKEEAIISQVGEINTRIAEIESKFTGVEPEKLDADLEDVIKRHKEAKKIIRTIRPKSLLQFIRENGGIYDDRGELTSMGITNKSHPSLLRQNRTIKFKDNNIDVDFDTVTNKAWKNGYFPEYIERPEINDLLEAIDDELRG